MKITNLLFLFLCVSFMAVAQQTQYTYVTDRQFHQAEELYGYTLVPNEWEDASGSHGKLRPGEVTFSITRGYLIVTGGDAAGSYGVNRIERENGRVLRIHTLDSKDPSKQGSLKVILDDNKNIDAYIFRRSRNHDEIIYYQAGLSKTQKLKDREFFTDKNELVFSDDTEIWGSTIRPHFVLTRSKCNRLYIKDDVSLEFIEDVEVKTKPIKEEILATKPVRKKKEEVVAVEDDFSDDDLDDLEDDEETTGADIGFFRMADDVDAVSEDEEFEDEFDTPADAMPVTPAPKAKQKKEKAPKEKRSYRMILRYNEDSGGLKEETYTIKKWKRMTSQYSGDKEARYAITMDTNFGEVVVYLNDKNAVSMVEMGGNRYLMRGY